ncbi:MAG TPA: hypothetical protein VK864_06565 [Longimicrobiales bacterium]|nr:hypothetical protein [Longimicrobiales bacterium]
MAGVASSTQKILPRIREREYASSPIQHDEVDATFYRLQRL